MSRLEELFWAKVEKTETCWNWTAYVGPDGYGLFRHGGVTSRAHRLAFQLSGPPIQPGKVLDHVCHNRACVNPGHLRAVTYKQNQEHRLGAAANSKTGIRGVSWDRRAGKWRGALSHNRKDVHAGFFENIADAEAAVIAARNELFTHNDLDRVA